MIVPHTCLLLVIQGISETIKSLYAAKLGIDASSAWVVGDSVWDLLAARRARALGVGLLSGGYGQTELEQAGAYRVYDDPRDMLRHLDELGVR